MHLLPLSDLGSIYYSIYSGRKAGVSSEMYTVLAKLKLGYPYGKFTSAPDYILKKLYKRERYFTKWKVFRLYHAYI